MGLKLIRVAEKTDEQIASINDFDPGVGESMIKYLSRQCVYVVVKFTDIFLFDLLFLSKKNIIEVQLCGTARLTANK